MTLDSLCYKTKYVSNLRRHKPNFQVGHEATSVAIVRHSNRLPGVRLISISTMTGCLPECYDRLARCTPETRKHLHDIASVQQRKERHRTV